jgi:hypothetical protein
MTEAIGHRIAHFEATLIHELNRLGAFATPQFRVPGTNTRFDVYIASPVRAFVEIKFGSPSTSTIHQLLQQSEIVRQQFGGKIVPTLVAGTELWRSSQLTQEFRDAGFFITSCSALGVSSARRCAKEIRDFLTSLRGFSHFSGCNIRVTGQKVQEMRMKSSFVTLLTLKEGVEGRIDEKALRELCSSFAGPILLSN